jgi:hypothetical protein
MSESERTFQIAQRVHRAFVESTMADARRDRLIGEYARAARAWQARGQSLGLEVAMQRSGLNARIRESWLDAVAFDFFRAVVTELQPLLETQLALRLAGLVGIEPWVVIALREREEGGLPGTRRARVPWEVVRRFSRWSLGSISVALAVLELEDHVRGRRDPDRFSLDWPLLWHLRERIPHPFALDDQAAAEFSNACALRRGELPISDCFLEQLWRDTTASWRAMATREVDERSLAGRSMAPRGSTGQLDDYPRDEVASAVLTAAALAAWFDSDTIAAELADRVATMFAKQSDEPLPPVFHLLGMGTPERWQQAAGPLTALLPTTYARMGAAGLGLPGVPERDAGWLDGSLAVGGKLLLFEGVLREACGALYALAIDPLEYLERTRDYAHALLGPLDPV